MLKYGRPLLFGGAIVALVVGAAVVSFQSSTGSHVGEQHPVVVRAANIAHATDRNLEVVAVEGTLSDFWGDVTRHASDLWLMENEDGKAIVRAEGQFLTAHFDDERPDTVAEVMIGTTADFMDIFIGQPACGDCVDQACCEEQCTAASCSWCNCTARMTCVHGVQSVSCDPGCEYHCWPPPTQN